MYLTCLDLEGVLVPEIWITFAEKTGIEALKATTRDIPDYDELMRQRIALLHKHNLGLPDIQNVIAEMNPLPGALEFVSWIKAHSQLIILSDTFYEFAAPLMKQLDYPTLFCNSLVVNENGQVLDYVLRQTDGKRKAVQGLRNLNFAVIAAGDSYNDTTMLSAADAGILFRPPQNVIDEFPQFPVAMNYDQLKAEIERAVLRLDISGANVQQL